jgi:hypothetical protein
VDFGGRYPRQSLVVTSERALPFGPAVPRIQNGTAYCWISLDALAARLYRGERA